MSVVDIRTNILRARRLAGRVKRKALRTLRMMPPAPPAEPVPWVDVRYEVSRPFLSGHGLEIGAGPIPQALPAGCECEYFDKRSAEELQGYFQEESQGYRRVRPMEEIPAVFPQGADFLIAHNVLEHSSNPLRTLNEWHRYLRDGGVCVLSVPDVDCCPDRGRLVPTLDHILGDFLLERDDDAFESREHVYSFVMGWIDDGFAKGWDKFAIAKNTHACAHAANNDLHWHAFNQELSLQLLLLSARISACQLTLLALASPGLPYDPRIPQAEMAIVYRLERGKGEAQRAAESWLGKADARRVDATLQGVEAQLREGMQRLQRIGK